MHVEKTSISPTKLTLRITATEEDLRPIQQKVLQSLAKKTKMPGFREGKVPSQLAEKYVDQSQYQADFLDEAMTFLYAKATMQEDVRPVSNPEVNVKKFVPFTTLEFDVTTSVVGLVKLGKYKGLKLTTEKKKVTAEDLKSVLETLQKRMSERKAVERAAKDGDETIIDFKGVNAKNEPIGGGEGKDYPLVLGSGAFIPGFEENLIGAKAGDQKTFTLSFPKDYGVKTLAGTKVTFTVDVKTVNEMILPNVDDELAGKVGPFKTVDELKEDIKKQLEHEAEQDFLRLKQNEALQLIADASEVAIPDELVAEQLEYEVRQVKQNIAYRGQTFGEYLEMEGYTGDKAEEEFKEKIVKPKAEAQVKAGLVLSEIAKQEGLQVSDEEIDAQIAILKTQYSDPAMQAELNKPEARQDIGSRILSQKVMDLVLQ